MFTLNNRTCYFAGATGMIGRGAVKALADGGMNVVMATHDPAGAEEVMELTKDCPGKVIALSNKLSYEETAEYILQEFGSLDVLISKTGGMDPIKSFTEITAEELNAKFNHQVTGPFTMIQAFLPYLNTKKAPRIILNSSIGALNGYTGESMTDNIGRSGTIALTRCLAREFSEQRITVNCIAFSGLINDHTPKQGQYNSLDHIQDALFKRCGTSDEYGALIAYLASEEAGYVTGQVFNLSGGLLIG